MLNALTHGLGNEGGIAAVVHIFLTTICRSDSTHGLEHMVHTGRVSDTSTPPTTI